MSIRHQKVLLSHWSEFRGQAQLDGRRTEGPLLRILGTQHPIYTQEITGREYYLITYEMTNLESGRVILPSVQKIFEVNSNETQVQNGFQIIPGRKWLLHSQTVGRLVEDRGNPHFIQHSSLSLFSPDQRCDTRLIHDAMVAWRVSGTGKSIILVESNRASGFDLLDPAAKILPIDGKEVTIFIKTSLNDRMDFSDDFQIFSKVAVGGGDVSCLNLNNRASISTVNSNLEGVSSLDSRWEASQTAFDGDEMYILYGLIDKAEKLRRVAIVDVKTGEKFTMNTIPVESLRARIVWDVHDGIVLICPPGWLVNDNRLDDQKKAVEILDYKNGTKIKATLAIGKLRQFVAINDGW